MCVRGWGRETRCGTNRMVAYRPGWRAEVLLWASAVLPEAALAQVASLAPAPPGEVACAGRGVQQISDEPNVRCPDWSTGGVCPPGCGILKAQDHCGSVCTAGPTVAIIASVAVVVAFVAGLVLGTKPAEQPLSRDGSPRASDDVEPKRGQKSGRSPNRQESGDGSTSPKLQGSHDFTSNDAFENAGAESPGSRSPSRT